MDKFGKSLQKHMVVYETSEGTLSAFFDNAMDATRYAANQTQLYGRERYCAVYKLVEGPAYYKYEFCYDNR